MKKDVEKMFNPALLMRADLRDLKPYQPHHYPGTIKLDTNENPYPFPPQALDEISAGLKDVCFPRYPDPLAVALRRDIAAYVGMQPEQVLVGNGSDELIFNLALSFGSGGKVVLATPTFSMYRIHSQIAGAEAVAVPREPDFSINAGEIIKAARITGAKLVVLCSPNNPTGNATPLQVIEEILRNTNAVIVVDQAYLEFGGENCVPLLNKYANLVILRTFSKAFGLAGLRVGYLLADPKIIKELMRVKQPYNLNSFSQAAARIALKYLPAFKNQWQKIIADREQLLSALAVLPAVQIFPTDANYILFTTAIDAGVVHRELLARKILIRNLGQDMPGYLRVNVGTPAENKAFMQAMQEIIYG